MKKTKNNENSKKYVRSIIISTLAFVISAIFFVIVSFIPFQVTELLALLAAVSIWLIFVLVNGVVPQTQFALITTPFP